jgi:hypothetical protein
MEFSTNENRKIGIFDKFIVSTFWAQNNGATNNSPVLFVRKTNNLNYDDPSVDSGEGDGGRPTDVIPDSSDRSVA